MGSLGTSSGKEAREYFSDMTRHRIRFRYTGAEDDQSIQLAFDKTKSDDRKNWLAEWTAERKRRRELGLPEPYLYGKDTRAVSYHDFVHKELVLFSNLDNERSIPCMVDGLKPGQRKVLFTCLKRNLIKELKVAQLVGSVAEQSAYHHGEQSLVGTIIGLAQNFVGSNNLNLLLPIGQFGTRLAGGKDAASARYIFTSLSPLTRLIFHPADDALLNYLRDDNQRIEPEWYCPIVPMVLINGAEGIGTGYSTRIPNYDVLEVIANIYRLLDGEDPLPMLPSFRGFRGIIQELDSNRYVVHGEIAILDDDTVEITELPIRTWTQNYKESVLEVMLNGTDKVQPCITDYKEYHTDTTVRFVIKMSPEKLREADSVGLHKFFKLSTPLTTNSMVVFDHLGCLKRYQNCTDLFRDFFNLRLEWYGKRKSFLEGMLAAEARKLENQARFVVEKIENKISIENRPRKDLIRILREARYDSDPVRAWKECLDKLAHLDEDQTGTEQQEAVESGESDFNYILGMPLWSLTKERKDDLLAQRDAKREELKVLRGKTPSMLWREDLQKLEEAYKAHESELAADDTAAPHITGDKKAVKGGGGRGAALKSHTRALETKPDPHGKRVAPVLDPELLKKVEMERKRRDRKINNAPDDGGALDISFDDDSEFANLNGESDPKPLFQRLATATNSHALTSLRTTLTVGKRGRGRGRGPRIVDVGPRDAAGPSPSKKRRAPAGSKRKTDRKPWESGSDSDSDVSFGSDGSAVPTGSPRATVRRAAAQKPRQYDLEDSEQSETEQPTPVDVDASDSEDRPPPKPVATTSVPAPAASTSRRGGSVRGRGRGSSNTRLTAPSSGRPAKSSKKPAAKQAVKFSSESDDDVDSAPAPSKPEPRMNARRAVTERARYVFDIESSEAEEKTDTDDYSPLKPHGKRARKISDDEDFDPSDKKRGKKVESDSESDF